MKKLFVLLLMLAPVFVQAQLDSIANRGKFIYDTDSINREANKIILHIDSLRSAIQAERDASTPVGVYSYNGSTGKDTAYVRLFYPSINYNQFSQVPIQVITDYGDSLSVKEDIYAYYEGYFSDEQKADLCVVIITEDGDWCFSGFWRPSGFISDVKEYELGIPVRVWEKHYDEFKLKE